MGAGGETPMLYQRSDIYFSNKTLACQRFVLAVTTYFIICNYECLLLAYLRYQYLHLQPK